MFINQYFLSNQDFPSPENGKILHIGNYKVWAHDNLEITEFQSAEISFVLLGFFVLPGYPIKSNKEILLDLSSFEILSKGFFDFLNKLVGRFVLLIHTKNDFIILNDARAQRQVFYFYKGNDFYCTSSPKLFYDLTDFKFQIPEDKKAILSSKRYKVLDEWFPGNEYVDEKLKRLYPNFYLNISSQILERIPFTISKMSSAELKEYLKNQIIGATKACLNRFTTIYFGVTGGSDSRLILSLNSDLENVTYFIYDREEKNKIDVELAKKLTERKNITLKIIRPKELSLSFLAFYKEQFLHPRVISKTQNYEWLKNYLGNKNAVVITGYSGEIYRNKILSVNPYHKKFDTVEDLIDYFHYPKSDYLEKMLADWLPSAKQYIQKCNHLTIPELFYWEIHVAYSALYAYEQDISGVEMFCPLSNRQMILNLIHNTTAEERSAPDGIIYQIINESSPEWKGIPYNPKPFHKKLKDEIFKSLPLKVVNLIINR